MLARILLPLLFVHIKAQTDNFQPVFPANNNYTSYIDENEPIIQDLYTSGAAAHFYVSNRILSSVPQTSRFTYVVDPITLAGHHMSLDVHIGTGNITGLQFRTDNGTGLQVAAPMLGKAGDSIQTISVSDDPVTSIVVTYKTLSAQCGTSHANIKITAIAFGSQEGGPTKDQWAGMPVTDDLCQVTWSAAGLFAGLQVYTDGSVLVGLGTIHTPPVAQVASTNATFPTLDLLNPELIPYSLDVLRADQTHAGTNGTLVSTKTVTVSKKSEVMILNRFGSSQSHTVSGEVELSIPYLSLVSKADPTGSSQKGAEGKVKIGYEYTHTTQNVQYHGTVSQETHDQVLTWTYMVMALPWHTTTLNVLYYNASLENIPWISDTVVTFDWSKIQTTMTDIKTKYMAAPFMAVTYNASMWGYYSGVATSEVLYQVDVDPPLDPNVVASLYNPNKPFLPNTTLPVLNSTNATGASITTMQAPATAMPMAPSPTPKTNSTDNSTLIPLPMVPGQAASTNTTYVAVPTLMPPFI